MRKIGVMGGTFNPIHMGHIGIANAAYEQFELDEVLFIPSGNPPHKQNIKIASNEDRYHMVCLAIRSYPFFTASRFEIEQEGYSYTYKTLEALKELYTDAKLYFIVGADSLFYFEDWKHPERILAAAHLLVANRGNSDDDRLMEHIRLVQELYGGEISIIHAPKFDVSSTQIRDGRYASGMISPQVEAYIRSHGLYKSRAWKNKEEQEMSKEESVTKNSSVDLPETIDTAKIMRRLKKKLDADRYEHTLGVAYTAAAMAMCHGADHEKAFLAGLLHDCAKCIPDEKKLEKCKKHNIPITQEETLAPYLLHSKLGAYYARNKYGVTDPDMLNAITWHTTGRPAMSKLEQIIFIADYIEPKRNKPKRLKQIRKAAFENLQECTYMILEDTVKYLHSKGKETVMDPNTMEAFHYYEKKINQKKKREANS